MLDEFVKGFKVDVEYLLDEMYGKLEELVEGAMFNMDFYDSDADANYEKLEAVMIEVLQEQFSKLIEEEA
jgi:hypothetical protein